MPQRLYLRRLALFSAAASAALYFGKTAPPARAQTATIAVTGSAAPGLPAGAKFSTFSAPQLNNAGQIGFLSTLQSGSGGVPSSHATRPLAAAPGTPQIAPREGSAAPGTPPRAAFHNLTRIPF